MTGLLTDKLTLRVNFLLLQWWAVFIGIFNFGQSNNTPHLTNVFGLNYLRSVQTAPTFPLKRTIVLLKVFKKYEANYLEAQINVITPYH